MLRGSTFTNLKEYGVTKLSKALQIFRQETPLGSRLHHAFLIKELVGTYIMAHQREAPTASIELLTPFHWLTLPGLQPLGSVGM